MESFVFHHIVKMNWNSRGRQQKFIINCQLSNAILAKSPQELYSPTKFADNELLLSPSKNMQQVALNRLPADGASNALRISVLVMSWKRITISMTAPQSAVYDETAKCDSTSCWLSTYSFIGWEHTTTRQFDRIRRKTIEVNLVRINWIFISICFWFGFHWHSDSPTMK